MAKDQGNTQGKGVGSKHSGTVSEHPFKSNPRNQGPTRGASAAGGVKKVGKGARKTGKV